MTHFLQNLEEVNQAKETIEKRGWPVHRWNHFKNWDLTFLESAHLEGDLLDIGCATSMPIEIASFLECKGSKVGLDLACPQPEWMPNGCEFVQGRAEALPFPDESFNTATCLSVIEHDVELTAFAKEAYRVLKPNGLLLVTFDFWPFPKPQGGLDWFALTGLLMEMVKLGFKVETIDPHVSEKVIAGLFTFGCVKAFK